MFDKRNLVIATNHGKEEVIAPIMEKELGTKCFIPVQFNTDKFGTFTGEIERTGDPLMTLRKKCIQAMEVSGCDLGIANEGSFSAHPSFFFINADEELIIFIDKKNDLEIIERKLSLKTNFNGSIVTSREELDEFAERSKFPTHALILRKAKGDHTLIFKGINNREKLYEKYDSMMQYYGTAYVETDMRALYNPTRMGVIKTLTNKLVKKIRSVCPACNTPGFGVTDTIKGLPCSLCGRATRSVLIYIYNCNKCGHTSGENISLQKITEEPMFCDYCNP